MFISISIRIDEEDVLRQFTDEGNNVFADSLTGATIQDGGMKERSDACLLLTSSTSEYLTKIIFSCLELSHLQVFDNMGTRREGLDMKISDFVLYG